MLRGIEPRVVPNLHEEIACNVATLRIAAYLFRSKRSTNPGPRSGSSKQRLPGFNTVKTSSPWFSLRIRW